MAEFFWGNACLIFEKIRECSGIAEVQLSRDVRYRRFRIGQKQARAVKALAQDILLGGDAEGLFKKI